MNHPLLDPHQIIAWDMDVTLVNGPNSSFFRAYILSHPEKEHHVVTFRTPRAWAEDVHRELEAHGVPRGTIKSVSNIPDDIYHAWAQRETFPQPAKIEAYLNYKGMAASKLGATVLIDDVEPDVIQGCRTYGITFVNAIGDFPRMKVKR